MSTTDKPAGLTGIQEAALPPAGPTRIQEGELPPADISWLETESIRGGGVAPVNMSEDPE